MLVHPGPHDGGCAAAACPRLFTPRYFADSTYLPATFLFVTAMHVLCRPAHDRARLASALGVLNNTNFRPSRTSGLSRVSEHETQQRGERKPSTASRVASTGGVAESAAATPPRDSHRARYFADTEDNGSHGSS